MSATHVTAEAFPPGDYIREELEARCWTQSDLAAIMHRPLRTINEIISGKKAITPETAVGLSQAFGTSPELWLNLETAYRLSKIDRGDDAVARKARIYRYAPVADMVKRGWIDDTPSIDVLEKRIAEFFEVTSLDEHPTLNFAARKSTPYEAVTPGQMAWLFRAKHLSATIKVRPFSKNRFASVLSRLKSLANDPEEIRHVPRVLSDAGIRFVVIEHLPGSRIDGAAFWLGENQPVISLSLRFDRIDWVWHTLGHELGHIANEDATSLDTNLAVDEASASEKPECEKRADEFGSQLTIPKNELEEFVIRTRPLFSKKKIVGFATRLGVHPGIVVGQLQYRGQIPYSHSREMLVKVRSTVTSSALTDGWGHQVTI
jgi:HTH-type transcriptional regulator/antitoxin HigA